MTTFEVTDRKGRTWAWEQSGPHGDFAEATAHYMKNGWEARLQQVKDMELRDDDVIICAYPKSGAHWLREIVHMVRKGEAEYDNIDLMTTLLDYASEDIMSSLPSPRLLYTHIVASSLPKQIVSKNVKILHILRNPKDIAVSAYHQLKCFLMFFKNGKPYESFSEFLPYVTGEYGVHNYTSMFNYWNEMEHFSEENPEIVLTLRFEDLKVNPTKEIRRVAEFLKKDISEELVRDIEEKCSFSNLKNAKTSFLATTSSKESDIPEDIKRKIPDVYRAGEVGDWKNYFTVAENEQFDRAIQEQLHAKYEFIYSL